jgi:tRNA nucleotidyltransferase/poly(A) polymerase
MADEEIREAVGRGEAYVVGGAVRDELLGRPVLDVDVACRDPERAARAYRRSTGGAVFLLSDRHGAWRVALPDGRTFDFTPLRSSIEDDLAGRDFTVNAIAVPVGGGARIDPFGGERDAGAQVLRAVSEGIFRDDPLRLLRAVRLEDELGFRLDAPTEALVRRDAGLAGRAAGERILAELLRISAKGFRRLGELGLLAPLGGSPERLARIGPQVSPELLLVTALGESTFRLPVSNELRRFARTLLTVRRPKDGSPREIHRFRRATEPWALEALDYLGEPDLRRTVEEARAAEPREPLLRGDELGFPPGPDIGRLLERIAEERAAGTIATREDALALVERERRA